MKRTLWASGLLALAFVLGGCDDSDERSTGQKVNAPAPDVTTRYVMACPKCGAPTKPYRVNGIKSYYRCTGQPPKFLSHPEQTWSHSINRAQDSAEK
ncbi:MAG: hypothetical protein ABSE73_15735 [Planctomycetota bacterium]